MMDRSGNKGGLCVNCEIGRRSVAENLMYRWEAITGCSSRLQYKLGNINRYTIKSSIISHVDWYVSGSGMFVISKRYCARNHDIFVNLKTKPTSACKAILDSKAAKIMNGSIMRKSRGSSQCYLEYFDYRGGQ